MTLNGARILVADDQRDVATTLTLELRAAGATLLYVTDGEEALRHVRTGGIDALLLDMKMPPGDWGGLWLLTQMRVLELTVPVIVLSGEGGQRQTIEALRLGARDWVDKGAAARELLVRCDRLLDEVHHEALVSAARMLPSPVAYDFERYAMLSGQGGSLTEGLRTLENTIKFAALVALADRSEEGRGIPGVEVAQFARPSLGTWWSVARALVAEGDSGAPAATWLAALVPERGHVRVIQELIALRNDLAHGGSDATQAQSDMLRACLINVAHRLSAAWRWQLHAVGSLEYDGTSFAVRTRCYVGTLSATPASFSSTSPFRTSDVVLVGPDGRSLLLAPWMEVVQVDGRDVIGLYDSTPLPRHHTGTSTPLHYADPTSRARGLTPHEAGPTWSRIRHHVDPPD